MGKDREQRLISRRDFFRLTGTAVGLFVASRVGAQIQEPGIPRPTQALIPTLEPTPSSERQKVREELLSRVEVNTWDGARSLPPATAEDLATKDADKKIFVADLEEWASKIDGYKDEDKQHIVLGEIRTHDQIRELMPKEYNFAWGVKSLSEAQTRSTDYKDLSQNYYVWVHSNQDGELPKAKDSADMLWSQTTDVLKNAWGREPSEREVGAVYQTLFNQLMGFKGFRDSETIVTRNTFPATVASIERSEQQELEICSMYTKDVLRGFEYLTTDSEGRTILVLSNNARFVFVFAIASFRIPVDDQPDDRLAIVNIQDKEGQTWYWQVRVFDVWSQPQALGTIPERTTAEDWQRGWGSQVLPYCGLPRKAVREEIEPEVQKQEVQPRVLEQQQPGQPSATATKEAPPSTPTEAPTNVDAPFATSTPQQFPTADVEPTRAG